MQHSPHEETALISSANFKEKRQNTGYYVEMINTHCGNHSKIIFLGTFIKSCLAEKFEYPTLQLTLTWIEKDSEPQIFMVLLTDDEKEKSGGYDVLVLSWVKIFTPGSRKKAVEQLGKMK